MRRRRSRRPTAGTARRCRRAHRWPVTLAEGPGAPRWSQRIDSVLLHPVAGPLMLAAMLFFMFQAVFSWAEAPMGWIEAGIAWAAGRLAAALPEGWLLSLLNDGVLAGVGAVVVFLPQILILFAFILVRWSSPATWCARPS
jgi:Fe2+ transport system protein B